MALGCSVVSPGTRARSLVRGAPVSCAILKLSANSSSSLSPSRLRQWLRSERSCGKTCWKNSAPGKYWKLAVVEPALARLVTGQREDVFEQKQPDHEADRCGGSALVAEQRRDLAVDPLPIDLASKLHQLVLEVDDLIEPRPEQIARTRRLMLLRPHGPLRCSHGIIVRRKRESPK